MGLVYALAGIGALTSLVVLGLLGWLMTQAASEEL
jgi:hypothetical protein